MVAVRPTSDKSVEFSPLDNLFDEIPDPPPKIHEMRVADFVVNPLTCAMVDVGDHSSANIDRMIEILQDIKSIKFNLDQTRKRVEREFELMCDKSKKSNTHRIIGDKHQLVIEYPSRSFNNSGLKKLWEKLSEQVGSLAANLDINAAKKVATLRDKFMRITEISVNLKDFKLYESADAVPAEYDELFKDIARLEDTSNWPSFKVPDKESEIGSDPIVVQKI